MRHQDQRIVDTTAIRSIIERIVRERLQGVEIEDVRVERIEFNDFDDDVTLHVTVVFDNNGKALDPKKTTGMVRHVRPELVEIGESNFPLFSFVKKSEAARLSAEVA